MATPVEKVYDAFLAKILEDEWGYWTEEEVYADLEQILAAALSWFKFPQCDLTIEDGYFAGDLDQQEIQILASYMRYEWINRSIMTWENIKPLYEERDFSQANLLEKLRLLLEEEKKTAQQLEAIYYRSRKKKPFDFTKLAGN